MRALLIAAAVIVSASNHAMSQEVCVQNVIANHQWERRSHSSLQQAQDMLLKRYAEFKQYTETKPALVRERLSADRLAVFDAVTRAMFTRLRQRDRISPFRLRTYGKIIDYVYAVTGIWGVRQGDTDGSRAFRMSIVVDPEFTELIRYTRGTHGDTFKPTLHRFAHVLMPLCQPDEGDDSPNYSSWLRPPTRELRTVRQRGVWPKMQISYWNARGYRHVLEVDIDFHNGGNPFLRPNDFACHNTPSNSDAGVAGHPSDLNGRFGAVFPFVKPFKAPCEVEAASHCAASYRTYCLPD